ncbi:hypothetical protein [Microscilla marina]|uniref:Lipoprotein n=1 Tax=Microscilla marina ATCC 23134 TaxID=313606 RepID=A1ZQQ6_MICM2|nr:hypothetical protein [Microscilla marina]EAY27211.1 hypothetical protein M23134_06521 [Microscilla marina ATCC 23134]
MKTIKKSGLILCFLYLMSLQTQAQIRSSFFQSKGFENSGVTEYLEIAEGSPVLYWTGYNKKPVTLIIKDTKHVSFDGKSISHYWVSFPGAKAKYHLIHTKYYGLSDETIHKLTCIHANGKVQLFTSSPAVFYSKNFVKKGLTEFLEKSKDGKFFWYYTNLNKQRKIKLTKVSNSDGANPKYRFPGQNKLYEITTTMSCRGGYFCRYPDGRVQRFDIYHGHE